MGKVLTVGKRESEDPEASERAQGRKNGKQTGHSQGSGSGGVERARESIVGKRRETSRVREGDEWSSLSWFLGMGSLRPDISVPDYAYYLS